MPPEIGIFALVVSVAAFVLGIRTRRDLFGGGGRFGRHPVFGEARQEDEVARALKDLAASNLELSRRLENLEAIATADPAAHRAPLEIPPPEPTPADRAAELARRLRG